MKTIHVEISGPLAEEIDALVQAGWFTSDTEITRLALIEFVHRHQFEMQEKFQRADIAWALDQRERRA